MKKRLFCLLTILCIVFSSNIAYATNVTTKQDEDIELMYEQVMNMSAELSISSLGKATCSGSVSVRPGYNVKLTI